MDRRSKIKDIEAADPSQKDVFYAKDADRYHLPPKEDVVDPPKIKEKNLFIVNVNRSDQLLVEENLMELNAQLKLELSFPCDRCGEDYQQELEYSEHIVLKFGEEKEVDSDELIILSPNAYKFSLKELFYEWIIVNLPVQRIHPEDEAGQPTCKAEHLERVQNALSSEVSEESAEDERWSELKKLITKN